MIIREMTESDRPVVSELLTAAFADDLQLITGKVVPPNLISAFIAACEHCIFTAEDEGTVLGAVMVTARKLSIAPLWVLACVKTLGLVTSVKAYLRISAFRRTFPKRLEHEHFIEAVAVAEGARGRGVGRELMVTTERLLQAKKARHLGLTVKAGNPAAAFYSALGFTKVKVCRTQTLGEWHYLRKTLR